MEGKAHVIRPEARSPDRRIHNGLVRGSEFLPAPPRILSNREISGRRPRSPQLAGFCGCAAPEAAVMVDILFWVFCAAAACGDVVVFREVQSPASVRPAALDWGTPRNPWLSTRD